VAGVVDQQHRPVGHDGVEQAAVWLGHELPHPAVAHDPGLIGHGGGVGLHLGDHHAHRGDAEQQQPIEDEAPGEEVDVAVGEAREQRGALEIDHLGVGADPRR
jgi:hypothetical protein